MRSLRRGGLLVVSVAVALVSSAARPAAPDDTDLNCAAARQLVSRAGASFSAPGQYTYDRYVRDLSFCQLGEILEPAWVPTRDAAAMPDRLSLSQRSRYDFW